MTCYYIPRSNSASAAITHLDCNGNELSIPINSLLPVYDVALDNIIIRTNFLSKVLCKIFPTTKIGVSTIFMHKAVKMCPLILEVTIY